MPWQELTLADVCRLVAAITQAAGGSEAAVRAIIDRMPIVNIPNGRVTLSTMLHLLEQTNGSTVLPDNIVALLHQPEDQPIIGTSVTYGLAQEIMGRNFLTLANAEQKFGITFDREQRLGLMEKVPFSANTLQTCKDTHILFPGYPISIVDIYNQVKEIAPSLFWDRRQFCKHAFATTKRVELRWYLLRKVALPDSTDKTFAEQQQMVGANGTIPRTCEFTYGLILYAMVTGRHLFQGDNEYARCADSDAHIIGNFNNTGVAFDSASLNTTWTKIGLAVCRRPEC